MLESWVGWIPLQALSVRFLSKTRLAKFQICVSLSAVSLYEVWIVLDAGGGVNKSIRIVLKPSKCCASVRQQNMVIRVKTESPEATNIISYAARSLCKYVA